MPPRGRKIGAEHLQRDGSVVPEIVSDVHGGHPALPELALKLVATCQGGGEAVLQLGQAGVLREDALML
jgi:hypothetical protein